MTLGLLAFAGGCEETVEGKYLDTEGIALVVDVTAQDETESSMELKFLSGGDESNTYVDLSADEVSASDGDVDKILKEQRTGRYETTFDTGAGGTEFSVALDRSDEDKTDALDSQGLLPEPFAVTVAADVSRRELLSIEWSPSGEADSVRIDVDGDCVFFTFVDDEADDGSFEIEADDLILGDPDEDDGGTCEATVTVTRTNFGSADPVFDSESKFRLHQVRGATFSSTP